MANQAKPRLAVIGVGDFYRMLVPGIENAFDVVARVDKPDFEPRRGGLRDYVAKFKPDAAMILTPNRVHAEHVVEMADLGIPTYVEKPLVTTAEAMQQIEESVQKNPALYCSDFYVEVWGAQLFKWFGKPTAKVLDQYLEIDEEAEGWRGGSAVLGDIVRVEATLLESVGPSSSFVGREWLWDRTHGGVLWDMAYHQLAMWFALFNEPLQIRSVERSTIPDAPPDASETYGAIDAISSSGIEFNVRVGKYIETGDDRAFKIFGTKGHASFDFVEPGRLVLNGDVDHPLGLLTGQRLDYVAPVFREWMETNPTTPYGLDTGRQCVDLLLRARSL